MGQILRRVTVDDDSLSRSFQQQPDINCPSPVFCVTTTSVHLGLSRPVQQTDALLGLNRVDYCDLVKRLGGLQPQHLLRNVTHMARHPVRDDHAAEPSPGAGAGEQSPLLSHNHNPDPDPSSTENDIAQQRKQLRPRVMLLVFAAVFGLELGVAIFTPPSAAIMERILCRDFYPEFSNGTSSAEWVPHGDCKIPEVQTPLAMLRGWMSTFEAIPAMLTAMPWGILSDRWGRRPVMTCGIAGFVLNSAFAALVCE